MSDDARGYEQTKSKGRFPLYVGVLVKRTLLKPILMREPSAVFRYVPDMSPFHYAPSLALPFSASLFFNVEKIISSTYVCWQDKEDPYLPRYASKGFLVLLYDSIQSCDFGFLRFPGRDVRKTLHP